MDKKEARNSVADLTWDEISRRIARGAPAILPIGAAAKEHGLHLPMNTDLLQAEWLAEELAVRLDALYWPTLSYGHYPAFVNYSGSVSVSSGLFETLVAEIVGEILRSGVPIVFVLDTGISTLPPVERAIASFGPRAPVHHLQIHDGPRYRMARQTVIEANWGGHADEAETSRMLVVAPQRVNLSRAMPSAQSARSAPGPLVHADPHSPNFSASGSIGDPTRATRTKGEALLAAMLDDIVETAEAALRDLRCVEDCR
jgi:creatinine amidohydrolase